MITLVTKSTLCLFSGISGSGKTYTLMQLLRQLFDVAGGGPETDAFKHMRAAFTVLQCLGSAATVSNQESSRMVSLATRLVLMYVKGGITAAICYVNNKRNTVLKQHPAAETFNNFFYLCDILLSIHISHI